MSSQPSTRAQPVLLAYEPASRRAPPERMVTVFTALSVVAVLGSGSVAWVLLLMHHR